MIADRDWADRGSIVLILRVKNVSIAVVIAVFGPIAVFYNRDPTAIRSRLADRAFACVIADRDWVYRGLSNRDRKSLLKTVVRTLL